MSIFLTPQGLEIVKKELEHIKAVKLPQAEKRFSDAKEFGYTKNDFEYTDSQNERAYYKSRIAYLTRMIETAKII